MNKNLNENQGYSDTNLPVVCTLSPVELGERTNENKQIFQNCAQVTELADGYGFRFDDVDKVLAPILDFIKSERECCQFLRFELAFEPQLGPLWLHLRGGQDAKEFVRVTFVGNQV